jgi:hypothetical protein
MVAFEFDTNIDDTKRMHSGAEVCVWLSGQQLLGSNPMGVAFDFDTISMKQDEFKEHLPLVSLCVSGRLSRAFWK